jgi:hypothetical protein
VAKERLEEVIGTIRHDDKGAVACDYCFEWFN